MRGVFEMSDVFETWRVVLFGLFLFLFGDKFGVRNKVLGHMEMRKLVFNVVIC